MPIALRVSRDLLEWLFYFGGGSALYDPTNAGGFLYDGTLADPMTMPNAVSQFYISLHTAWPGPTGNQSTSEVSGAQFQNYARQSVGRTTASWTDSGGFEMWNKDALSFPVAGAASAGCTITHVGIGRDVSGTGVLYACGPLAAQATSSLTMYDSYVTTVESAPGAGDHVVTSDGHPFQATLPLRPVQAYPVHAFAVPTGITSGTVYYGERLSASTFRLHTSSGGSSSVNVTALGPLLVMYTKPIVIPAGGGNLVIYTQGHPQGSLLNISVA